MFSQPTASDSTTTLCEGGASSFSQQSPGPPTAALDSTVTLVPQQAVLVTPNPLRPLTRLLASSSKIPPPKLSLWQRLKAENEARKAIERVHVTADEAKRITGYGEGVKSQKKRSANEGVLLEFNYDTSRDWGARSRQEMEEMVRIGKVGRSKEGGM